MDRQRQRGSTSKRKRCTTGIGTCKRQKEMEEVCLCSPIVNNLRVKTDGSKKINIAQFHQEVDVGMGDLFVWESNHGPGGKYWEPTTGFMTVTCGLTGKKSGLALCPTLVIEYATTVLF